MTATITRSIGISPGVPWAGPLPGGGYEGKTRRLDRAVQRFAEWLQEHIAGPVQIRFNSDRLSGGAYVYPGARKIEMDTPEIGLSAGLIISASVKQERDRAWKSDEWRLLPRLESLDCWTEETPLDYNVLVYPQFLRNANDRGENRQTIPGFWKENDFGYWTVKTPQEAYRLLRKLAKENIIR